MPRTLRRIHFEAYSVASLRFCDGCSEELLRGVGGAEPARDVALAWRPRSWEKVSSWQWV